MDYALAAGWLSLSYEVSLDYASEKVDELWTKLSERLASCLLPME